MKKLFVLGITSALISTILCTIHFECPEEEDLGDCECDINEQSLTCVGVNLPTFDDITDTFHFKTIKITNSPANVIPFKRITTDRLILEDNNRLVITKEDILKLGTKYLKIKNNPKIEARSISRKDLLDLQDLDLDDEDTGELPDDLDFTKETYQLNDTLNVNDTLNYLTHWSKRGTDDNYLVDNQWPIMFPKSYWSTNKTDTIEFSYSGAGTPEKAGLFSNWLNKGIDGSKLRFKFTQKSNHNFSLKVITFNEEMVEKHIRDIYQQNESYVFPVDKNDKYFRIGFTVETNHSGPFEFSIESIDFGDPCVEDSTEYNLCSDQGKCKRKFDQNKLVAECECKTTFTGPKCEAYDYCEVEHEIYRETGPVQFTGKKYCTIVGGLECQNNYRTDRFGNFSCSCGDSKYWNLNKLKCANDSQCITKECHFETQECKEPKGNEIDAKCVCKPGYVNTGDAASPECEVLDPCKTTHRKIFKNLGEACENKHAECKAYGAGIDDYMCICKEGYKTQKSTDKYKTTCKFIACSFPSLNKCDQNCFLNKTHGDYQCTCNELYDLGDDGKSCKVKPNQFCSCDNEPIEKDTFCHSGMDDCVCKTGYLPNKPGIINLCKPDFSKKYTDICPGGLIDETKEELSCLCDKKRGFEIDSASKTCKLMPICGKNGRGRDECSNKNALCIYNNKTEQYECVCPVGKVIQSGTCIDFCEYEIQGNLTRSQMCQNINGICNPLSNKPATENVNEFCECGPGYTWNINKTKCLIVEFVSHFSLRIKDTFRVNTVYRVQSPDNIPNDYYHVLNDLIDEVKSVNDENRNIIDENYKSLKDHELKKYLKEQLSPALKMISTPSFEWSNFDIIECKLENGFYNCDITTNNKAVANKSQELLKICAPVETSNECLIFKNTNSLSRNIVSYFDSEFSLILDRKQLEKIELKPYSVPAITIPPKITKIPTQTTEISPTSTTKGPTSINSSPTTKIPVPTNKTPAPITKIPEPTNKPLAPSTKNPGPAIETPVPITKKPGTTNNGLQWLGGSPLLLFWLLFVSIYLPSHLFLSKETNV